MSDEVIIKISVIMPFYNVEKYISKSIESILSQEFKEFEFIIVNDGSTDGSPRIAKEYAKKDSRIQVIDKKNGGASSARNVGLSVAKGKYIYFMDSDDYLAPKALGIMYETMEENDLDQVVMSPDNYMERDDLDQIYNREYSNVMTGKELFEKYVKYIHFCSGPPFRMIKREFIELNDLSFFEGIIFEDELFTFKALMASKRVKMINKRLYFVTQREDSVMFSTINEKRFISYVTIINKQYESKEWRDCTVEQKKAIYRYFKERFSECNEYYYNMDKEKRKQYTKEYQSIRNVARRCEYYGDVKTKILCVLPMGYEMYYKVIGRK